MGIDTSMGFVAFPRGLTTWEWYDDPNTCRLFCHLMLTANWEAKNWHGIVIAPGSRVTSIKNLAEETGLTIKNVRTSLEKLKTTNYLAIKTTNKYSVISLNNWDVITGRGKLTGNQKANKRQTSGNQTATTKPLKPLEPLKQAAPPTPSRQEDSSQPAALPPLPPSLEENWQSLGLGRRMGPAVQQALRAYLAAGLEEALLVQAMREAAEHEAKAPLPYIRSILDRCQAQGVHTLAGWQAAHRGGGGKRVDRETPSGNDCFADAMTRPRRHKRRD